jgi:hypothetical protein
MRAKVGEGGRQRRGRVRTGCGEKEGNGKKLCLGEFCAVLVGLGDESGVGQAP